MANGTLKVENIQTSSGSGTITLGQSGETINFPSGVTITNSGTNQLNYPAFALRKSSNQSISTGATTLITWDVAQIDTDNGFSNSSDSYTIPTGKDGIYFCTLAVCWSSSSRIILSIQKNGTDVVASDGEDGNSKAFQNFSCLLNLNAGDVLKTYYYMVSSGGPIRYQNNSGQYVTRFEGYRIGS